MSDRAALVVAQVRDKMDQRRPSFDPAGAARLLRPAYRAAGGKTVVVARNMGVSNRTMFRWLAIFVEHGVDPRDPKEKTA